MSHFTSTYYAGSPVYTSPHAYSLTHASPYCGHTPSVEPFDYALLQQIDDELRAGASPPRQRATFTCEATAASPGSSDATEHLGVKQEEGEHGSSAATAARRVPLRKSRTRSSPDVGTPGRLPASPWTPEDTPPAQSAGPVKRRAAVVADSRVRAVSKPKQSRRRRAAAAAATPPASNDEEASSDDLAEDSDDTGGSDSSFEPVNNKKRRIGAAVSPVADSDDDAECEVDNKSCDTKTYKCPTPGCDKTFNSPSGYSRHRASGSCAETSLTAQIALANLIESELHPPRDEVSVPKPKHNTKVPAQYACQVGQCNKRYMQLNGLRRHYEATGPHGWLGRALLDCGGARSANISQITNRSVVRLSELSLWQRALVIERATSYAQEALSSQ